MSNPVEIDSHIHDVAAKIFSQKPTIDKDAEITHLKAEVARLTEALEESRATLAKRAKVRVSVHDVWLRERILREQAEATIADLRRELSVWQAAAGA